MGLFIESIELFQSLFCWKLFFNNLVIGSFCNDHGVFQSLFCWKLFFNFCLLLVLFLLLMPSFNPCFAGSCFSTHLRMFRMRSKHVSILVLLEAVFQRLLTSLLIDIYKVSILVLLEAVFQPGVRRLLYLLRMWFQSLFCWKLFFNSMRSIDGYSEEEFQSLFCWKLFFNLGEYLNP